MKVVYWLQLIWIQRLVDLRTKYQAYLLSKADFDNEFISLIEKLSQIKQKKLKKK